MGLSSFYIIGNLTQGFRKRNLKSSIEERNEKYLFFWKMITDPHASYWPKEKFRNWGDTSLTHSKLVKIQKGWGREAKF